MTPYERLQQESSFDICGTDLDGFVHFTVIWNGWIQHFKTDGIEHYEYEEHGLTEITGDLEELIRKIKAI